MVPDSLSKHLLIDLQLISDTSEYAIISLHSIQHQQQANMWTSSSNSHVSNTIDRGHEKKTSGQIFAFDELRDDIRRCQLYVQIEETQKLTS